MLADRGSFLAPLHRVRRRCFCGTPASLARPTPPASGGPNRGARRRAWRVSQRAGCGAVLFALCSYLDWQAQTQTARAWKNKKNCSLRFFLSLRCVISCFGGAKTKSLAPARAPRVTPAAHTELSGGPVPRCFLFVSDYLLLQTLLLAGSVMTTVFGEIFNAVWTYD